VLIAGCQIKTETPVDILKQYRHNQDMNSMVVDIEKRNCKGKFTVYKSFGLDELPIIKSWSCTYE
jgi:hypothetical protein